MKKQKGITLIALVITIIVLLILAGVAINTLMGDTGIINSATNVAEQSKIASKKTEIELAIIEKMIKEEGNITIEQIIDELEKDGIINEGDGDAGSGQVKTQPDGYIYEIKEDENGNWEVIYIGKGEIDKTAITISVEGNTSGLTGKVTLTIKASSGVGITKYTDAVGSVKTYTAGSTNIEETYEVTANGSYTFTVENSSGKTASKTVEISNILEGTIQITATPSTPTKNNVTVTVVWPSNASNGIKEISTNGGTTWQTVTGETSEVEVTSNCTVKARVKNSTEDITTATLEINNIDKTNPTVTATEGTETIKEGDSNELSKYFTCTANGTTSISSVAYTDTSNGNVEVTNTNTLAVGAHIIKCTVTKETGATASATKTIVVKQPEPPVSAGEIASNPSEFGQYVTNYTTPSGDPNVGWRIFYADESNIYLIADDYIHYNYAPKSTNYTLYRNSDYKLSFNSVYQDYAGSKNITDTRIKKWIQKYLNVAPESTNKNIRAVAFMLDETIWSAKYANSSYAEYAIGGPTLELFVASYNKTHQEKPMYCSANATGYYISWTNGGTNIAIDGLNTEESLYVIKNNGKAYGMWLGSPSTYDTTNLMSVNYYGSVNAYNFGTSKPGFRPLVCLKSGIQLEKQSDGNYIIVTDTEEPESADKHSGGTSSGI